jgi:hypothetical protein
MTRLEFTQAETTHAHPSTPRTLLTPLKHYDPTMERSSTIDYNSLFANGLQLRGLAGEGRSTATQVYCPEVRRSGFDNNFSINHLDSVACWRGLDLKQAEEILTWERVFRKALEEQIACESAQRQIAESHATAVLGDEMRLSIGS